MTLGFREGLAEIDFAVTTRFEESLCKKFPWADRDMLVFAQYPPLSSGIEKKVSEFQKILDKDREDTRQQLGKAAEEMEAQLEKASERSEESFRDVRTRIDTFLTLIFAVLAVLFAALGIIATRSSEQPAYFNPTVVVSALALFFALLAYVHLRRETPWKRQAWPTPAAVALLVAIVGVVGCQLFYAYQAHVSAMEVREAKEQVTKAVAALNQEGQLRQQSDTRLESLQQQVRVLQNQTKRK